MHLRGRLTISHIGKCNQWWDCLVVKSCNSIYLKLSTLVIPVAFSRVKKYFHLGYFLVCFQLIVRSQLGVDKRARLGCRELSGGQIQGALSCLLPITRSMAAPPLGGIREEGGREGASSRLSCITAALQCGSAHCFSAAKQQR